MNSRICRVKFYSAFITLCLYPRLDVGLLVGQIPLKPCLVSLESSLPNHHWRAEIVLLWALRWWQKGVGFRRRLFAPLMRRFSARADGGRSVLVDGFFVIPDSCGFGEHYAVARDVCGLRPNKAH